MTSLVTDSDVSSISPNIPSIEWFDGEPQFRFFVAGASTAGKTVFLASLYKNLAVPGNRNKYFATLSHSSNAESLSTKIAKIMNPQLAWPESDYEATEYVFRCFYNSPRVEKRFPLFRFHYSDFPGKDMTSPSPAQMINVHHSIDLAHTIVFLLDGRKILDAMEGRTIKSFSIYDDLDVISVFANSCIYRPIQFVITKWDILKGYSLASVRQFLLRSETFVSILRERRVALKPTYLIPVSSVGDNFATYDPTTNRMIKRPDAVFNPYNLDVCLAVAITDALISNFKMKLSSGELFWFHFLKACLGVSTAVRWFAKGGEFLLGDPWSSRMFLVVNRMGEYAGEGLTNLQNQSEERLAKIKDRNSALDNITEIQRLLVHDFLQQNPSANLMANMGGDQ